jgi:putative ABC transport system permease protein
MEFLLQRAVSGSRFMMRLLAVFAGLALLLATVGIYGVISYSVSQRTHEIGVRMALGAGRRDIVRLVVGHGLVLILIGTAAGIVTALALTRFMTTLLFNVSPTDPLTFVTISLTGRSGSTRLLPAGAAGDEGGSDGGAQMSIGEKVSHEVQCRYV